MGEIRNRSDETVEPTPPMTETRSGIGTQEDRTGRRGGSLVPPVPGVRSG